MPFKPLLEHLFFDNCMLFYENCVYFIFVELACVGFTIFVRNLYNRVSGIEENGT